METKTKEVSVFPLWVGLDVAKDKIDYSFLPVMDFDYYKAKFAKSRKISNDIIGYRDLVHCLTKEFPKRELRFVCETTGIYNVAACAYLSKQGFHVSEEPAIRVKRFFQSTADKGKNDSMDAKMIAYYGEIKKPKANFCRVDEILELERLLRLKKAAMHNNKRLKNLKEAFYVPYLAVMTMDNFQEHKKASMLILDEEIAIAEVRLKSIENQLNTYVKETFPETYECLISIPHVGAGAAVAVIAASYDFKRFDNQSQFLNYGGLAPRPYESGSSIQKGMRLPMGAHCDRELRTAIYMAAGSANMLCKNGKCKNKRLQATYAKIPEHFAFKKTTCILARKLAIQLFVCGKYKKHYANM